MPKRLTVPREPTADSHMLPGVPRPRDMPAGSCALVRALMAALQFAGRPTSYDTLMGLTGTAFVLPVHDESLRAPGDPDRCIRITEALRACGLVGNWLSAAGTRLVASAATAWPVQDQFDRLLSPDGRVTESKPATLCAAAQASLRLGYPVPALGWPEPGDDWALITGYDSGRDILCGWPAHASSDRYLGAPATVEALITFEHATSRPDEAHSLRKALEWAARQDHDVARAYARWGTLLQASWERAPNTPELRGLILRHETLAESLADARTAAVAFLRSCADLPTLTSSEALLRAAEAYDEVVARLERRDPPLLDERAGEALLSDEWREHWALDLGEMAAVEQDALAHIRQALWGDPVAQSWRPDLP